MTDNSGDGRPEGPSETPPEAGTDTSERTGDGAEGASGGRDRPGSGAGRGDGADRPSGVVEWFQWFRTVRSGPMLYVRDFVTSVAIVLLIGGVLFGISGVWPPMVAIESGSMEPNMVEGDLVLVVDNERFTPDEAITHDGRETGVVPADVAQTTERTKFNAPGDVIIFRPNGNTGDTPVIHRAMFWVEDGENWYDRADPDAVGGAEGCADLLHCPADRAGFITKGDNERTNANYDQVTQLSAPVRPGWILGTAEIRVPYLGHVRLLFSGVTAGAIEPATVERTGEPIDERPAAVEANATTYERAV